MRFQRVRDLLLTKGDSFVSIEKCARTFGFNHMGQFSGEYEKFFKELPSQTIKSIPSVK